MAEMSSVVVPVAVADMPDRFRQAVHAVPNVAVVEVNAEGAIIARRTTFAFRSETTRFKFEARPEGGTEVSVVLTSGGALGFATYQGALEMGRKVLDELAR